MKTISSAEIAHVMLKNQVFLTISEVTLLAQESYPDMLVTREQISNVIRHFVRSERACCEQEYGSYPYRYLLHGIIGYQFKVRGRSPDFEQLLVSNTTKQTRLDDELRHREMCEMANAIFSRLERKRREKMQCQK